MGIGDMIGLVSAVIGMTFAYPALLLLFNIVFANSTSKSATRLNRGLAIPFFTGLILTIIGGVGVVVLLSIGSIAQLIGFILLLVLLFWATLGIAAMAWVIGQRIAAMNDREFQPFIEIAVGGLVLSMSFGFPLVGWFVLLPLSIAMGIGLTVLSFFQRRPRIPDAQPTDDLNSQTVLQVQ